MNVSAESYGHAVILNLKGELTEDALQALEKVADHQLEGKNVVDLILNLERVPFIDSAVLEYLLDLQDRLLERMGQVKFVKCDKNVRKILEITRLAETFEIFDDISQAVQAIGA